jgi:hypothetical protein
MSDTESTRTRTLEDEGMSEDGSAGSLLHFWAPDDDNHGAAGGIRVEESKVDEDDMEEEDRYAEFLHSRDREALAEANKVTILNISNENTLQGEDEEKGGGGGDLDGDLNPLSLGREGDVAATRGRGPGYLMGDAISFRREDLSASGTFPSTLDDASTVQDHSGSGWGERRGEGGQW